MRRVWLGGSLLSAALIVGPFQSAQAARLVYYTFDSLGLGSASNGASVANGGTLGTAGTISRGTDANNAVTVVASGIPGGGGGNALQLTPANDGLSFLEAGHVNTNFSATALGITPGTAYTAMAWVKFDSAGGDNMVFGQGAGNVLHHGTRNGNLHSGHWGDDIGPDQGVTVQPGTSAWHHVAYTNDGPAGNQSIYMDGVLVAGPGASGVAGGMDLNALVLLGTSGNGGSFSGAIDEVKIFDENLTQPQIQAQMAVPEPASIAFAALGGLTLAARRRRRAAH